MAAEQYTGYIPPGRFWLRNKTGSRRKPAVARQCKLCPADISGRNANCRYCQECAFAKDSKTTRACRGKTIAGIHHPCKEQVVSPRKMCRACGERDEVERQRLRNLKRRERDAAKKADPRQEMRKALPGPRQHIHRNQHTETDRKPQRHCEECCGMSWRRTGACGCGPYEPEPTPERIEVLRSSMGTTVQHGEYHGCSKSHFTPGAKVFGDKAYRKKGIAT